MDVIFHDYVGVQTNGALVLQEPQRIEYDLGSGLGSEDREPLDNG